MANKKITELDAATTLASTDVLVAVDVSEDVTKKTTVTDLFRTLPDGTAAAPALAFSSDAANGLFLASSDTVGISTGGTQRVTVDGSGNVTISGGLTVEGQTTTVESTIVTIDDKNIELGSVASPSNTTADGGGITLKGATDKTIKWINSTGFWTFNTGVKIDGNLQMDDGKKIRLGGGQDLQIFHDGNDSYLHDAGTGSLIVRATRFRVNNAANTENIIRGDENGAVYLYYDNSQKLITKSDGIDVTGEVQCDSLDVDGTVDITGDIQTYGHLDLRDTKQLKLGNSDDLKLYHDGSHSVIEQSGTGHLYIRNKNDDQHIFLQNDNGSGDITTYLKCDGAGGQVRLYHYGNQKLTTKSDGIDVTGEVQCDSLDVNGVADITGTVSLHGTLDLQDDDRIKLGTGDDLQIYHTGSTSYIDDSGTGNLHIRSNETRIQKYTGEQCAKFIADGAVELYHDNTKKLETFSGGVDVTGEVQCDSLDVDGNGDVAGTLTVNRLIIDDDGSTSPILSIRTDDASPYAFTLGNDSYSTSEGVGFRAYQANSGEVNIRNTGNSEWKEISLQQQNGGTTNTAIHVNASRAVSLRYQNAEKLRTKSDGVNVVGELECDSLDVDGAVDIDGSKVTYDSSNGLKLADNVQLRLGGGNDLRIYHDGSNSYIDDAGTGVLNIRSNDLRLGKYTGELGLQIIADGETRLHYDNSVKLATKTGGVDITGEISVEGSSFSGLVKLGSGSSFRGEVQYIYGGGSNKELRLDSKGSGGIITLQSNGTESARFDSSGRLLLGTTTEGSGFADNLTVADSGHSGITIRSGTSSHSSIYFSDGTSGNAEYRGYLLYDHAGDHLAFGTEAVERFRITSTGAWSIEGANNYGTSGQVLTSNGNDAPTWQDAGAASVGGASAISMNDNVKINFGNSNDLQIYHDGSNSRINNNNLGSLVIKNEVNDADIVLSSDNGSGSTTTYVRCDGSSGEVQLNHYGSQKFRTKSDGVDITGELQCDSLDVDGNADFGGGKINFDNSGNVLDFADNVAARFGTGDDLRVYHDGSHSYVKDNGTGNLKIVSNGTAVQIEKSDGENMGVFRTDGAVELYHNNSKKFETKSDGVDVIGELQCDSLDVDGNVNINNGVNTNVTVQGTGDVVLTLNADTDNSNESHHPELRFTQDGSHNCFNIGVTGQNGENFSGSTGNNPYLHVTTAHSGILDLEIATNGIKRCEFSHDGHFRPATNNTYDIGSSSNRWRNIYTNDLNLSNEGSTNDVDGTWGNYTIQEGEDDLFLINRRNGKKYKFNLTEVS